MRDFSRGQKRVATEFQKRVWEALKLIPEGRVTTYKAIAEYMGTRAIRAVGSAVGKNPYAPEVPCHRVVPSDGSLGNYSAPGGAKRKMELLAAEGVRVENGKIADFESLLFEYKKGKKDG